MKKIQEILGNVDVIIDMFNHRTGLDELEDFSSLGYAVISFLAALSAHTGQDFAKINLVITQELPGIRILNSVDIPAPCREIYELWLRFTNVLDESVVKLNFYAQTFPEDVEHGKNIPRLFMSKVMDPGNSA